MARENSMLIKFPIDCARCLKSVLPRIALSSVSPGDHTCIPRNLILYVYHLYTLYTCACIGMAHNPMMGSYT